ncbi:hypothetical protein GSI_01202 [Ganoderma sinense ZZ0214-1]|uniref:Uncharacterized protein n=1 Tax=Ganoderma sinense ZZ0214-1 TaxID=1077348 RepID=A0A2G8SV97_9APHY|nr:hypothetical protein GSI_01202 [Ganoderma sinense ZZ0214-1]
MSHSRFPAVEMTLDGTVYVGQIIHSGVASSVVAWGYPNIESGAFIAFHLEVVIFKATTPAGTKLLLVLEASDGNKSLIIDLKENILMADSTRPNVLASMNEAPSCGLRITFSDIPSAVEFETWMHASLLEIASEDDGVPLNRVMDLLMHPEGIEYDEQNDTFPALERLAEDMQEIALREQVEEMTD